MYYSNVPANGSVGPGNIPVAVDKPGVYHVPAGQPAAAAYPQYPQFSATQPYSVLSSSPYGSLSPAAYQSSYSALQPPTSAGHFYLPPGQYHPSSLGYAQVGHQSLSAATPMQAGLPLFASVPPGAMMNPQASLRYANYQPAYPGTLSGEIPYGATTYGPPYTYHQ